MTEEPTLSEEELSEELNDSTDVAEQLLNLGRKQGFVTFDDILEIFPEAEANIEEVEDAFLTICDEFQLSGVHAGVTLNLLERISSQPVHHDEEAPTDEQPDKTEAVTVDGGATGEPDDRDR